MHMPNIPIAVAHLFVVRQRMTENRTVTVLSVSVFKIECLYNAKYGQCYGQKGVYTHPSFSL